jgi:ABC-type antimicrobial peptide transport system permease subunit
MQGWRSIERELGVLDRDVPVDDVIPMENLIAASAAQRSFLATLIGCFGGLALLLSVVGIYGVLAYQVTQRTGEIGIRMALGAPAMGVLRQVIYDGMTWAALGVAAGAATSLLCGMYLPRCFTASPQPMRARSLGRPHCWY